MKMYAETWNAIKTTGKASVTVSRDHARTVIRGVVEIKSDENVLRKRVGLLGWSKLVIVRVPISATHVRIDFSFAYSTNL